MSSLHIDQALADQMVENGVVFCAQLKFNGDQQLTLQALRQGRCDICAHLGDSLIQQVGEYLGQTDRTVKAVYEYEPEYALLRPHTGDRTGLNRRTGINLVAWVDRKSAALSALGATLESMISEGRRKLGCRNAVPACQTLDIQLVDDKEVQERRSLGVLVNSMYMSSRLVWSRIEPYEQLVLGRVNERSQRGQDFLASLDPELAPETTLFEQALAIENMPPAERAALEHRLQEIKVVLIRRIISDQLAYIHIAKNWFSIADLAEIHQRKIGYGKIGGKAAGMMLAERILRELADDAVRSCLRIPESYFLGSDLIYIFMAMNGLMHWNDQKYKPEKQIRAEYAQIQEEFQAGEFPPEVVQELRALLEKIGRRPIIVRSSSQLEDNFGTSFAGKYDSYFCPNQAEPEANLQALTRAIARTYASTLKPDALLYRRSKGLQDYDERMAALIQVVQGEQYGRFYFPQAAGVAFSRNLYRWSPQIRREEGFVRLVWGLGTRAVDRAAGDFPRLVALDHPALQPDDSVEAIRKYSQQSIDVIDLEENTFRTLDIRQILSPRYPSLRYLFQLEQDGFLVTPRTRVMQADLPQLVLTFDEFLRRTQFAPLLSRILRLLEESYHAAVDLEFTVQIPDPQTLHPEVQISLLQCRPQSHLQVGNPVCIPKNLSCHDLIFSTTFMVPQGYLPVIRYVIFVSPEEYYALPDRAARAELGRIVGQLNLALAGEGFICVGPGRWGTTNIDLGVYVTYSDIFNAGALVELSGKGIGPDPEPSLGTHFFQDLMEAQIYPLAVRLDDPSTSFNRDFFYKTRNCIQDWLEVDDNFAGCVRLIEVAAYRPGYHLELIMDDERGQAAGFLAKDP